MDTWLAFMLILAKSSFIHVNEEVGQANSFKQLHEKAPSDKRPRVLKF